MYNLRYLPKFYLTLGTTFDICLSFHLTLGTTSDTYPSFRYDLRYLPKFYLTLRPRPNTYLTCTYCKVRYDLRYFPKFHPSLGTTEIYPSLGSTSDTYQRLGTTSNTLPGVWLCQSGSQVPVLTRILHSWSTYRVPTALSTSSPGRSRFRYARLGTH